MSFLVDLDWLILVPVLTVIGFLLFRYITQYQNPAKKRQFELVKISDGLLKYKRE